MWFCLLKVSCGTKVFISWYNIETEEGLTLSGSKGWLYKLCYYVNLYSMGHIWIVIRKSLRLNPDPTTATKRKLLMHLKFKRFEFGTPWPSQLHEVFNQARIQEFSSGGGGSYIPENVWPAKQKLNKKRQKGGGAGGGLQYFFCIVMVEIEIAIETAFMTTAFINMTSPSFLSTLKHIWHNCFSIVICVSGVTVAEGGGGVWRFSPRNCST